MFYVDKYLFYGYNKIFGMIYKIRPEEKCTNLAGSNKALFLGIFDHTITNPALINFITPKIYNSCL